MRGYTVSYDRALQAYVIRHQGEYVTEVASKEEAMELITNP